MSEQRIDVTYWLDLDTLDAQRATYKHHGPDTSLAGVWIDREQWEDMGRPGRIEVTPRAAGGRP